MNEPASVPRVGIVVLNWKRPADTIACVESLVRLSYPSYEIIVVDNGTDHHARAAIRRRFPSLTVVENGRNLGFAGGSNVGIAHLLARGVDYVLLLNDDTEVAEDLLRVLVDVGEAASEIGILGPSIYYFDRPNVLWSAGGAVDPVGEPRHLGLDRVDDGAGRAALDVDYVTGCAILVKRAVVERIGMLDERFFAYFEETEWCARARRAGFRVVHVPRGRVWHKIEAAERGGSRHYLYLMARNRLLYLRCIGARWPVVGRALVDLVRTAMSWTLRPRHRQERPYAGAIVRGVCDFMLGRFGAPPAWP